MRLTSLLPLLSVTLVLLVGCQPAGTTTPPSDSHAEEHHDGHDHGDHAHEDSSHGHGAPATFAAAVEELKKLETTIRTAFTNDKGDDAHDALHEVGHLLECLPALAAEQKLAPEKVTGVGQACESLMEAFGKLDEAMHGGESIGFDAVEAEISSAMETLTQANAG